jgi:hypothetical protein
VKIAKHSAKFILLNLWNYFDILSEKLKTLYGVFWKLLGMVGIRFGLQFWNKKRNFWNFYKIFIYYLYTPY